MSPPGLHALAHEEVARFFDDFCRAFATFDGAVVAKRYLRQHEGIAVCASTDHAA
ncbi:hypothetical protein QTH91_00395 [Variovorax dokdonensis]|uniref:Uncharacterized protein n=1 Tax=Variovorax dokdonensis TaxID=344883 RepID=A0ABT7N4R2_9BURK|nr:hypothetical protein [Variovorax dokdonensis]MDM0042927.1 hypothetical protein [Variovorax dokdonensis]